MFIETEGTPNPATLKFLPGRDVMGMATADFATAASAERSPLATAIFELPGVTRVFLGSDFVTVTKTDAIAWQSLDDRSSKARKPPRPRMSARKTPRSSPRSRSCWRPGCARRSPATAATSCSAAIATAW
jgi:hypothetical protein